MPESFRSFSKRIEAGLPLVSDEEKEFEKEAKEIQAILERRNARREKLLWNSIPLLARNWKLFRKYPRLYNIPIDFTYFGDFFSSISWELQYHKLPLGGLVAAWKTEACQLSCPECQGKAFLVPQHTYERHFSCGWHDLFEDTINCSNPYHVFCEKCGKVDDCYDFSCEISHKQSLFESVMLQWNRHANPAIPALEFEHALHLLALGEASGEESGEFRYRVPKKQKKRASDDWMPAF